jgi:hypothetical protein
MAKTLKVGKSYAGRPPGVVPINISLPREAAELLVQLAATSKGRGDFVARLIFEHQVRQEERRRMMGLIDVT